MSMHWRRTVATSIAATLTLAGTAVGIIASESSAQASVAAGCRTEVRTVNFQEGVVAIQIGSVRYTVRFCWNSAGNVTTASGAAQNFSVAPGGMVNGYKLVGQTPVLQGVGSAHAHWIIPAYGQACGVKWSFICSYAEYFETTVNFYSPAFIGPIYADGNGFAWGTRCTDSKCLLRFRYV